jgi:hypothetical protein
MSRGINLRKKKIKKGNTGLQLQPVGLEGIDSVGFQNQAQLVTPQIEAPQAITNNQVASNNSLNIDSGQLVQGAGNVAGIAGNLISDKALRGDEVGDINEGAAIGGGALSGAAKGASIGSVIPGVGTAIGAGVGALAGAIGGGIQANKRKKEIREAERRRNEQILQNATSQARQRGVALAGQSKGQVGAGFFKQGGEILAENGINLLEGNAQQLSNNLVSIQGNSHEQGGIGVVII